LQSRRGAIARPAQRNSGGWSGGSATLLIDTATPFFPVGSYIETWQGASINKVGSVTGWTWGTVTGTCADYNLYHPSTNAFIGVLHCGNRSTTYAQSGDSGSPYFYWNPGGVAVAFVGTLSAGGSNYSVHSDFDVFLDEAGISFTSVNPLTDVSVGTPSLSGTVCTSGCSPTNIPRLSWTSVTATNTFPGASTQYWVYQQTYDASTGDTSPWSAVGGPSCCTFDDTYTPILSYSGASQPGGSWVSYAVYAYNSGVYSHMSNVIYYTR
jgi:hypothetical protein